jgi:hypothetical protein
VATLEDVHQIVSSLPGTVCSDPDAPQPAFSVESRPKPKGIAWSWLERIEPKKPRKPRLDVLAVRVANDGEKQSLLAAEPDIFFTEPHYNGFPAVLVRLDHIPIDELTEILTDAWRRVASARVVQDYDKTIS